jgi:hypothetical protein
MHTEDPTFESRRRILIGALGAAAAATLSPSLHAQSILGQRPQPLAPGTSFYRIEGRVTVDGEAATMQTPVRAGSTVATGDASEAIFAVGTQAMLLRANSRIALEPDPLGNVIAAMRIIGRVLSVSRDSHAKVFTATATCGIRGTGWYVEAYPDLTYFCTCYGEVEMVANDDPTSRETVVSRQHDRPLYIARDGAPGAHIRSAPFINHSDQELAIIEAIVGREPPFVFPRDIYNAPRRRY